MSVRKQEAVSSDLIFKIAVTNFFCPGIKGNLTAGVETVSRFYSPGVWGCVRIQGVGQNDG